MGGAIKKIFSPSKPKAPPPAPPPPPPPTVTDAEMEAENERKRAAKRRGAAASILTSEQGLGGNLGAVSSTQARGATATILSGAR